MRLRLESLWCVASLTLLATADARATELCVKCTGPDANYACVVGGTSAPNTTLDTVSKFYCITTLAKAGSHASCAIDRTLTAPCPGQRKDLPIPAFLDGGSSGDEPEDASPAQHPATKPDAQHHAAAPPPGTEVETSPAPEGPPPAPITSEPPPKTVQEMVEKSAKSAGDGISQTQETAGKAAKSASTALEKAGSAVGGAAKSSWKCLSSFFSNC